MPRKPSKQDIQQALSLNLLSAIYRKVLTMSGELDTLTTQVASNGAVIDSAIVLIQGIKAALDAAVASGDPAALQALSDALAAKDAELAAAVEANTPAAP